MTLKNYWMIFGKLREGNILFLKLMNIAEI